MIPRQQMTPVQFRQTRRRLQRNTRTSGRAGKIVPVLHGNLFAGDSGSGVVTLDVNLAEMPRPVLNGVILNAQAWLVPKAAHPKFAGFDDYMHAKAGTNIEILGTNRTPESFFTVLTGTDATTAAGSELFKSLGVHVPSGEDVNTDLIDAYNMIVNFRLAAHSSKLTKRQYAAESVANSTALARAFWPGAHNTQIVPDYEQALVVGQMGLDVSAGQVPVSGIGVSTSPAFTNTGATRLTGGTTIAGGTGNFWDVGSMNARIMQDPNNVGFPAIFAEMSGFNIDTTLADIDKARLTQSFARMRAMMAGNDATGFDNDETLLAMLMSGIQVPEEYFKRPMLLDSSIIPIGFRERFASDSANLDDSVSEGMARVALNVKIPRLPCEATLLVTMEVVPEKILEAQSDEYLLATTVTDLPDALSDIQRTEPVDTILVREIDSRSANQANTYGYAGMNMRWDLQETFLGGDFFQADPATPDNSQRQALWLSGIINPTFTDDHWLVPAALPHDVFSDTLADAFEVTARQSVVVTGLTQMGDPLSEDNANFTTVADA